MKINSTNLSKSLSISKDQAELWTPFLQEAMDKYSINTENRICMFIAQCAHESANFSRLVENLNYSAEGLAKTWKNRFANADGSPNQLAISLARKPQQIANSVYSNRLGNRGPETNDGWNYRGRGIMQNTGADQYKKLSTVFSIDLMTSPDILATPKYAALAAGWYWNSRNINLLADNEDIVAVTKAINGGTIGLVERTELYHKVKKHLFS